MILCANALCSLCPITVLIMTKEKSAFYFSNCEDLDGFMYGSLLDMSNYPLTHDPMQLYFTVTCFSPDFLALGDWVSAYSPKSPVSTLYSSPLSLSIVSLFLNSVSSTWKCSFLPHCQSFRSSVFVNNSIVSLIFASALV